MRWGVVTFPGSNDDRDTLRVARACPRRRRGAALAQGRRPARASTASSCRAASRYGDYLRCGAIARFSPIMDGGGAAFAAGGGLVLGICNGFQILCEAGLLPGALVRNRGAQLRLCERSRVRVEDADTPFTYGCRRGERARAARSSTARAATSPTRRRSRRSRTNGQVVFRYADRAGRSAPEAQPERLARATSPASCNAGRNVVGLMPHPEHAVRAARRRRGRAQALPLRRRRGSATRQPATPSRADRGARALMSHAGAPPVTADAGRRARPHAPTSTRASSTLLGRAPTFEELGVCSASCGRSTAATRARARCCASCRRTGPQVLQGPGRERRRGRHRRRARGGLQDREPQPSRRSSSRSRARRPASAASCATSSPWARGRSPSSTRCASASFDHPRTPLPGARRGRRHRRLRQLHRRADGRRRGLFDRGLRRATSWSTPSRSASCRADRIFRAPRRRRRQPGDLRRLAHRPRRHPRRQPARLGRVRRAATGEAADRAGRRSVHREAAARGVPRARWRRDAHRRHPGHGRRRADQLVGRDGGARRRSASSSISTRCRCARRA